MRVSRWLVAGAFSVAIVGLGCNSTYGSGGGGCTAAASPDVNVQNTAFCPATRTVAQGTFVTWTNLDGFSHTTTSDASSTEVWNGSLTASGTFSHQFNTQGTFTYHCTIHPGMHGTIIVN